MSHLSVKSFLLLMLQPVYFLLAKHGVLSPTSNNVSAKRKSCIQCLREPWVLCASICATPAAAKGRNLWGPQPRGGRAGGLQRIYLVPITYSKGLHLHCQQFADFDKGLNCLDLYLPRLQQRWYCQDNDIHFGMAFFVYSIQCYSQGGFDTSCSWYADGLPFQRPSGCCTACSQSLSLAVTPCKL